MTRAIAVVTAGLGHPSTTRLLADRLAEATNWAAVRHLTRDVIRPGRPGDRNV